MQRGEGPKLVERCVAVADHTDACLEYGANSIPMFLRFASTAELRVSDRDEIVDKVNWTHGSALQPAPVTWIMEASVTDIEIQSAGAWATAAQPVAQDATHQSPTELFLGSGQDFEQCFGGVFVEDTPDRPMLDNSLRLIREVF